MRDSPPSVNARLARALRNHGVRYTLRAALRHAHAAFSRVLDRHFDIAFGTDTRGMIENDAQVDVTSPNRPRGIRYEPTHALPLRHVLQRCGIPTDGGFVDLGCGKGRGLIVAVLCGFPHVTGVDYSPALSAVAERNLEIVRRRTRRHFTCTVSAMDAADYAFAPHDNVVYLFNPFDAVVLAAVVVRLRRSLTEHPRAVWIVYHNPVWRMVIDHTDAFAHVRDVTSGGSIFAIYRSR